MDTPNYYEYFNSFVSFYLSVRSLPDDYRLALYDAYFAYAHDCIEPDFSNFDDREGLLLKSVFENVRPNLDRSHEKYDNPKPGAPKGNRNAAKNKNNAPHDEKAPIDLDDDLPADDAPAPISVKTKKQVSSMQPPPPGYINEPPKPPKPRRNEPPTSKEYWCYVEENAISNEIALDFWQYMNKTLWNYRNEPVEDWTALLTKWKPNDKAATQPQPEPDYDRIKEKLAMPE